MSADDLARVRMTIRGRVQGVFFRAAAAAEAQALGLRGMVRNRADGAVEIVAEGTRRNLERLLEWAHTGPSRARVDEVRSEWGGAAGEFDDFAIR